MDVSLQLLFKEQDTEALREVWRSQAAVVVMLETFFLGSNLLGFWRFYFKISRLSDSGAGT